MTEITQRASVFVSVFCFKGCTLHRYSKTFKDPCYLGPRLQADQSRPAQRLESLEPEVMEKPEQQHTHRHTHIDTHTHTH